jgi:hypothetical protein
MLEGRNLKSTTVIISHEAGLACIRTQQKL